MNRGDRPALWSGGGKRSVKASEPGGFMMSGSTNVSWTDAAKELADEHGIDIATVQGTGADGNITKADVQAAVDAKD